VVSRFPLPPFCAYLLLYTRLCRRVTACTHTARWARVEHADDGTFVHTHAFVHRLPPNTARYHHLPRRCRTRYTAAFSFPLHATRRILPYRTFALITPTTTPFPPLHTRRVTHIPRTLHARTHRTAPLPTHCTYIVALYHVG